MKIIKTGCRRVLGIDPGSINCGYAIVEVNNSKLNLIEAGLIKFQSRILQEQLLELNLALATIFQNEIDEVAMEDIFFAHNPKTVLKLAQFRGALSIKILEKFGKFYEYKPLEIKKALTGVGNAQKEQVAFMVKKILGIKGEIKPLDITDAMAVAITHINSSKNL